MFNGTPAVSDVVEFDITEGDEWAQNRAREIEAILNNTAPPMTYQDKIRYDEWACELRYLDVPLSRRLIIANYGTGKRLCCMNAKSRCEVPCCPRRGSSEGIAVRHSQAGHLV